MKDLPFEFPHRWADIGADLAQAIWDHDEDRVRYVVGLLENRDRELEDFLGAFAPKIVFHRDEAAVAVETAGWSVARDVQIYAIIVDLPTSDVTDVEVRVDGVTVQTVSCTGTDQVVVDDLSIPVPALSKVTAYCADVGFELVVTAWLKSG